MSGTHKIVAMTRIHTYIVLQYAHVKLKADRQVVIAAVSKDGNCLQHADTTLRADLNVVKIAVSESGNALRCVSPQLRAYTELMVLARRVQNVSG